MTPLYSNERAELHRGDCLEVLPQLDENSADAMVADPPSGTGFMGEAWDGDKGGREEWITWLRLRMEAALRVLKPGAHIAVWALPRTSHWTGMALELAGFEIRDSVHHIFSTGFPKNTRLSRFLGDDWDGLGSALKPAHEVWWIARAPLAAGSIAANAERWGTGALNLDACRVPCGNDKRPFPEGCTNNTETVYGGGAGLHQGRARGGDDNPDSRWPPNQVFSHALDCEPGVCVEGCVVAALDAQSGRSRSAKVKAPDERVQEHSTSFGVGLGRSTPENRYADEGGASRFFPVFQPDIEDFLPFLYCPKPGRREKCAGLDDQPLQAAQKWNQGGIKEQRAQKADKVIENCQGLDARGRTLIREDGSRTLVDRFIPGYSANPHPTVKPIGLLRWLARLVTPPGGVVVDPFNGSGSMGCAAAAEAFRYVGIELDDEDKDYCGLSWSRILHHQEKHPLPEALRQIARTPSFQRSLF